MAGMAAVTAVHIETADNGGNLPTDAPVKVPAIAPVAAGTPVSRPEIQTDGSPSG